MITIADHTLSRLVAQTKPHMGGRYEAETVQSITLDHDGTHLYAMATNRYTLAVSRTRILDGNDEPWSALVYRTQVQELAAAIRLLDTKPVSLERADTQLILSGQSGSRIAIDLIIESKPLDWRKVLLPALAEKATAAQMAMSPKFFGAWRNLPDPVSMWSTGQGKPTLIVAADFLGAQMPVRRDTEDLALRRELDTWQDTQRAATAESAAA
ncbi:hypothetical protein ADK70_12705 [Streptomyces rimosus subsp. pseudoverticillatus]|uniref:hypothetical protein n=1 Tax=Streptomyces rimosus TaxID=1927 RepID=UPI0006B268FB|nr:hypothetical protein [Streptomyces rimosus]KOT94524.1 hypothetical protein ADK70_12705 [Streptomyces rimosus subsp. pseudoverticillatus]